MAEYNNSHSPGKLKIVGIGPGDPSHLTERAILAIREAEVVVGYSTYIGLIKEMLSGKIVLSTGMKKEKERCRAAIDYARSGKNTIIISSGDSGIYGMAGLALELLIAKGLEEKIEIEIIPGIPALCAASSLLGAPLMHDFSVISLSDLLTPWELIKKRIIAALDGDFVIVLYNPRSRSRKWQLSEVIRLIREKRGGDIPIGIVKNATRKGEMVLLKTIENFDEEIVDMTTILVVGNSKTRIHKNFMITPRGYEV